MAGEKNLALIEDVTRKWVSGKYDEILPYVADDAIYQIARGAIEKYSALFGTFTGKGEITTWYEANRQASATIGIRPFCAPANFGTFFAAGDKVINLGSMPKIKSMPESDWVAIWTLDGGKIKHCWMVMDTASTFLKMKHHNPKLVLE